MPICLNNALLRFFSHPPQFFFYILNFSTLSLDSDNSLRVRIAVQDIKINNIFKIFMNIKIKFILLK